MLDATAFARPSLTVAILRPGWFMQDSDEYTLQPSIAAEGKVVAPTGEVRVSVWENQPRLVRRKSNGVWPVCRRKTFTKWDASEKPARRPTSAVVTRSKSGDSSMRTAKSTRAWISMDPKVSPHAANARCRVRVEMLSEVATSAACREVSGQAA